MKAVIIRQEGGVENLQFSELEIPNIESDEVLVKVKSISINPIDVKTRAGVGRGKILFDELKGDKEYVILGWDISGEVVQIGDEVTSFRIGDEVFGMANYPGNGNAYAEFVAVPEKFLALKPSNVTHEEAAASSMVGTTAYQALVDVAKIQKGDRVLIHGASGGVGHLAIQIAKYFGAYVIGTSSEKNRDFILSLGADEHIDYARENFAEKVSNVDIVLDTLHGETLFKSIDITKPGGAIVTLLSTEIPEAELKKAKEKQVNMSFMMVNSKKETITAVATLLQNMVLKPKIQKVLAFKDIAKAHLEVEANNAAGKVVVNI